MTPEELRERIVAVLSHPKANGTAEFVVPYMMPEEIIQLFADLCGEVIGVTKPSTSLAVGMFQEKQRAKVQKLTGREIKQ